MARPFDSLMHRIDRVRWGEAGAAALVRSAVKASSAILVEQVIDAATCAKVSRLVSEAGPAGVFEPHTGENIISYARNYLTAQEHRPARLSAGIILELTPILSL